MARKEVNPCRQQLNMIAGRQQQPTTRESSQAPPILPGAPYLPFNTPCGIEGTAARFRGLNPRQEFGDHREQAGITGLADAAAYPPGA
jgi:hypothetical protein